MPDINHVNALMNRPIDCVIYISNDVFIILCDIVLNINDDQGFFHLVIFFTSPVTVEAICSKGLRVTILSIYTELDPGRKLE